MEHKNNKNRSIQNSDKWKRLVDIWKYRHLSSLSLSPDAAGPEEAATLTLAPEPERGGRRILESFQLVSPLSPSSLRI